MSKKCRGRILTTISCLVLLAGFAMTAVPLFGESITVAPFKINIKAQGQFEDVLVVIRMPLASGYSLADYDVRMKFDGIEVSQAYAFRYCPIDDNFLASFDRMELQQNPDVIAMAGQTVTAVVEGWYTAISADGQTTIRKEFSGIDLVEILNPGK